jgi:hypothetical protein
MNSTVRFTSFPRTKPPPHFVPTIVSVFQAHEPSVSTVALKKGLESDGVLKQLAVDLKRLGFDVEASKTRGSLIMFVDFHGPMASEQTDPGCFRSRVVRLEIRVRESRDWLRKNSSLLLTLR